MEDADRLEAEPDDFHERIRQGFLALAGAAPERYLVLDATTGAEQLHRQILTRVQAML